MTTKPDGIIDGKGARALREAIFDCSYCGVKHSGNCPTLLPERDARMAAAQMLADRDETITTVTRSVEHWHAEAVEQRGRADGAEVERDDYKALLPDCPYCGGSETNDLSSAMGGNPWCGWCDDGKMTREIKPLVAEVAELRAVLTDIVDDDACSYDHHGYCQAHGWFDTDPACPHDRSKTILAKHGGKTDER